MSTTSEAKIKKVQANNNYSKNDSRTGLSFNHAGGEVSISDVEANNNLNEYMQWGGYWDEEQQRWIDYYYSNGSAGIYCEGSETSGFVSMDNVTSKNNTANKAGIYLFGYEWNDNHSCYCFKNTTVDGNIKSDPEDEESKIGIYNTGRLVLQEGITFGEGEKLYYNSRKAMCVDFPGGISSEYKIPVDFKYTNSDYMQNGSILAEPFGRTEDAGLYKDNFTLINVPSGIIPTAYQGNIILAFKGVWVDGVNGSDDYDGTTIDTPKKSVPAAIEVLKAQYATDPSCALDIYVSGCVSPVEDEEVWDGKIEEDKFARLVRWSYNKDHTASITEGHTVDISNIIFDASKYIVAYAELYVESGGKLTGGENVTICNTRAYWLSNNQGEVDLEGITFDTADCYAGYAPSPIFNQSGNLKLSKVTVNNVMNYNSVLYSYNAENTIITGSTDEHTLFYNCFASEGGILKFENSKGQVEYTDIIQNSIGPNQDFDFKEEIGVINVIDNGSDVSVSNCQIYDNSARNVICAYTNNPSEGMPKLNVSDTLCDKINVVDSEVTIGGDIHRKYNTEDEGRVCISLIHKNGEDAQPVYFSTDNPLSQKNYYNIQFDINYLNHIIVNGNDQMDANKYKELFKLYGSAKIICSSLTPEEHNLVCASKDIYLSGIGDDGNSGIDVEHPVRTFEKAKEILRDRGVATTEDGAGSDIVICGTLYFDTNVNWSLYDEVDEDGNACLTNNNGESWQPKVRKNTGNFINSNNEEGNYLIKVENTETPIEVSFKNIIFDGSKEFQDKWESASSQYDHSSFYFNCPAGLSLNIGDSTKTAHNTVFQNFYNRVMYIATSKTTALSDDNFVLNMCNTDIKDNGIRNDFNNDYFSDYFMWTSGALKTTISGCNYTNNNFKYNLRRCDTDNIDGTSNIFTMDNCKFVDGFGTFAIDSGKNAKDNDLNITKVTNVDYTIETCGSYGWNPYRDSTLRADTAGSVFLGLRHEVNVIVDNCKFHVNPVKSYLRWGDEDWSMNNIRFISSAAYYYEYKSGGSIYEYNKVKNISILNCT